MGSPWKLGVYRSHAAKPRLRMLRGLGEALRGIKGPGKVSSGVT